MPNQTISQNYKVVRVGACCDKQILKLYASEHQTFLECETCKCRCITPGLEDGQITCWPHHDCNDGGCTHQE